MGRGGGVVIPRFSLFGGGRGGGVKICRFSLFRREGGEGVRKSNKIFVTA